MIEIKILKSYLTGENIWSDFNSNLDSPNIMKPIEDVSLYVDDILLPGGTFHYRHVRVKGISMHEFKDYHICLKYICESVDTYCTTMRNNMALHIIDGVYIEFIADRWTVKWK